MTPPTPTTEAAEADAVAALEATGAPLSEVRRFRNDLAGERNDQAAQDALVAQRATTTGDAA